MGALRATSVAAMRKPTGSLSIATVRAFVTILGGFGLADSPACARQRRSRRARATSPAIWAVRFADRQRRR